jgi:hypothetical protein
VDESVGLGITGNISVPQLIKDGIADLLLCWCRYKLIGIEVNQITAARWWHSVPGFDKP